MVELGGGGGGRKRRRGCSALMDTYFFNRFVEDNSILHLLREPDDIWSCKWIEEDTQIHAYWPLFYMSIALHWWWWRYITHCTGSHYVHRLSFRLGGPEGETRCPRCSRASALSWCPADSHSPSSAPVSPRRSPAQSGRTGSPIVSPAVKLRSSCCCCRSSVTGTPTRCPAESPAGEAPPDSASSAACRPRRTYWRGAFAQRPSGFTFRGHVVRN